MKITTEEISIPAALMGADNPLPFFKDARREKDVRHDGSFLSGDEDLFGFDTGFQVLPDLMQDGYHRSREPRPIKSIVLENEHLKAIFLPEYGGRLYSLWDKDDHREVLFRNPVFQPANLAIRNAWFSGGIEWNLGVFGHSTHTCAPMFFGRVPDGRGGEFLRMWEYQRTRGIFWNVDFHLPDRERELGVYVRIINDTGSEVPMYWWSNTAVPEDRNTRVFSGTPEVIYRKPESVNSQDSFLGFCRGGLPELESLPGRDASYPLNFDYASEYFFQTPSSDVHPWEAAGQGDGGLFFERSTSMLRYRKMFCWGNRAGGRRWCDHLSVPGEGDYVELQAGLARTQVHGLKMPPDEVWEFSQFIGSGRLDPDTYTGDWPDARDRVLDFVDSRLPGEEVDRRHAGFTTLAEEMPAALLHSGTGWGRLEAELRKTEGWSTPEGLIFPDECLDEAQAPWIELLSDGRLPGGEGAGGSETFSWNCDPRWKSRLEAASKADPNNPESLIHLGVIAMEGGDTDAALSFWQESVSLRPTAMAWRNIAVVLSSRKELRQAEEAMRRAISISDQALLPYLSEELMRLLVSDGRFEDAWKYYDGLPESIRDRDDLVMSAAEAAFHLENEDFLQAAFARDYPLIREGDRRMVDLWLRHRDRRGESESQPPANLDFRMVDV